MPLSVSIPRNSPANSIVTTSLSDSNGSGPCDRTGPPGRVATSDASSVSIG